MDSGICVLQNTMLSGWGKGLGEKNYIEDLGEKKKRLKEKGENCFNNGVKGKLHLFE